MAEVRNVIFDLGGVLLDWNPGGILERCYADTESRNALRDALFRHEDWLAFNRGDLTEPDLFARVQQRTGRSLPELTRVLDTVRESLVEKPETVATAIRIGNPASWKKALRVLRETDVSTLYDGGNNVGMLVMYHATRAAIEKAATRGVAIIGVTNSWMSGRSAYYVEMIAKADLVGIHTASSARSVAPFGGARAALGTNPIAFGMPSSHGPVVFDMGTSAFMGTDRAFRERLGQLLPEGVAVDAEGRPTRDPAMARLGALLPFGGYKGFGLALIVQAFGVLAGSALDPDKDDGYLFVVFKPDLLVDLDDFKQQVSELIDRVKATPRQPGVSEIRIPGERALRSRERALREGIEVDRVVYEALAALHV